MADDPSRHRRSQGPRGLSEFIAGQLEELPSAKPAPTPDRWVSVGTGQGGWWSTDYPLEIEGVSGQDLTVRQGFLGGLKLLVDGDKAKRGSQRGTFLVSEASETDDGRSLAGLVAEALAPPTEVMLRAGWSGTDPQVSIGSTVVPIGRRIEAMEWMWVGLPMVYMVWNILVGGALGVLAGGLAFLANVRIFVNDGASAGARYLRSLAVMLGFLAISLALSLALVLSLDGGSTQSFEQHVDQTVSRVSAAGLRTYPFGVAGFDALGQPAEQTYEFTGGHEHELLADGGVAVLHVQWYRSGIPVDGDVIIAIYRATGATFELTAVMQCGARDTLDCKRDPAVRDYWHSIVSGGEVASEAAVTHEADAVETEASDNSAAPTTSTSEGAAANSTTAAATAVADPSECVPEGLEANGWVTDTAGVLDDESGLEEFAEFLGLQRNYAVALITDSGPCSTDDFAAGLLQLWAAEDPRLNDGFVVLIDLGKGAAVVEAGPGIRVSEEVLAHTAQAGFDDFAAGDFDTGVLGIMVRLDLLNQDLASRPEIDADRIDILSDTPGIDELELVGSARDSDGAVSLTRKREGLHQAGAVWLPDEVAIATGFESQFVFEIDHISWYTIGDGFAFVIQDNHPRVRGQGASGNGYDGIPSSVAIEFDTVFHDYMADPRFPVPGDGPPALLTNHIAVHSRGSEPNWAHGSAMIGSAGLRDVRLYDRRRHVAHVRYLPGELTVFVDDLESPVLTVQIDLVDRLNLGDGAAFIGFTAGTEPGSYADFLIHSWTFSTCDEGTERCVSG